MYWRRSATKWAEAAHTLKARIYLHQVEKSGNAQYTSALAEARKGISAPANDWKTAHTSSTSERNMWAQFAQTSFGPDLVAGSALVNLMKAQNDPRIGSYYQKNSTGRMSGYDVSTGTPDVATISALVTNPTASQPIITYDETQLIIAEAAFQHERSRVRRDARSTLVRAAQRQADDCRRRVDVGRHHERKVHRVVREP